jgi:hypothetical protein
MIVLTQQAAADYFKCITGRILGDDVFELLDGNALVVLAETSGGTMPFSRVRYELWDEEEVQQYCSFDVSTATNHGEQQK